MKVIILITCFPLSVLNVCGVIHDKVTADIAVGNLLDDVHLKVICN